MSREEILREAGMAPVKHSPLDEHWMAIAILRRKGYSWREVSAWLDERGVKVHHSSLHRMQEEIDDAWERADEQTRREIDSQINQEST